jgi:uncharacterized integral membrane protein
MTEQPPPQGATTTLPLQSANGTSPQLPATPGPPKAGRMNTRISGMRTSLIAAFVGLIVAMIFISQNVHAANISFLGMHLVLPLAGALLLAAIAGSLLTVAAEQARITRLRQIMRHRLGNALWAKQPPMTPPSPLARASTGGPQTPAAFVPGDSGRPAPATAYPAHVTD